jgi:hypothetical protein
MISFLVRVYLKKLEPVPVEKTKNGLEYAMAQKERRVYQSTIECKDYQDAKDVADYVKGVRETELCIRFQDRDRSVVITYADVQKIFAEIGGDPSLDDIEARDAR